MPYTFTSHKHLGQLGLRFISISSFASTGASNLYGHIEPIRLDAK